MAGFHKNVRDAVPIPCPSEHAWGCVFDRDYEALLSVSAKRSKRNLKNIYAI